MELSTLPLLVLTLISNELALRSIIPPNPSRSSSTQTRDSLRLLVDSRLFYALLLAVRLVFRSHSLFLVLLAAFPDLQDAHPCLENLLSWTLRRTLALAITIPAGILRVSAYKGLGKDFTFGLQKPVAGLQTDGIYRYIQHPSYVGLTFVILGQILYWQDCNGILGCFVQLSFHEQVITGAIWPILWLVMLQRRVLEEEALLKREFGKEWEIWHANTARFIPFVL